MKDPRLKILAVVVLSLSSFLSGIAALFTVVWWIFHDSEKRSLLRFRPFWIYLGIITLFGLLIQIEGGDGVGYLVRFGAIALIAVWTYREYRAGEFLDVAVWVFGKEWGFELGLVAEMSMQGLRVLREDMDRIRMALALKGQRWSGTSLPSVLSLLLYTTLRRADRQALLLALRGYRKGGELCPQFSRAPFDILSALSTLLILALSLYLIYVP
ncbi:MAG: energy-coupling factor transporter transmembrane protein EcfT [Methanomicrobiales archaeon]|nr:energy-coupling factor transporter transmembrane protein EcfT [Methanomicrobiales archaeon]